MSEKTLTPDGLYYTKDHEWVRVEGDVATVGITDFAQHALGDVTYVDLPKAGKAVRQFAEMAAVESAKAASDIFAPVTGVVAEVNTALADAPERVNKDPYGEGWLCRIGGVQAAELANLLTAEEYRDLLSKEPA